MKEMLKTCPRCGKLHPIGYKCRANANMYYRNPNPEIAKFRKTGAWKNKAIEIKERDKYLCQICLSKNIFNYKDLSVHHIIPLDEDFSKRLDNDNLICVCAECHRKAENGEISRETLLKIAHQNNAEK